MQEQPQLLAQRRNKRPVLLAIVVLLLTAAAIWRIGVFTKQQKLSEIRNTGESRITLYTASLRDTLERYRYVPYFLSRDGRIRSLLKEEILPIKVNPHLEDFSLTADALIYVMDSDGNTVASSNWRSEQSLIGHNFSFRPYFQDAQKGKSGGYYAVGLKTRKPGFFVSYPVFDVGHLLGVVVVKTELEALQDWWRTSQETIIVSDSYGVVFLSSRADWKYLSLRPLPQETATRLRKIQYLEQPLNQLGMVRQSSMGGNIIELGEKSFFEQSLQLAEYGWRIHYLSDLQPVKTAVMVSISVCTIVFIAISLSLLYLFERRQKIRSKREAEKAKEIFELNELLKEEIAQHKTTAATLKETELELVQADKLAALGRMSAAIAHELNQPVTAIRTFLASCRIFSERKQHDKVEENLQFIDKLARRMTHLTGQLKTFARKTKGKRELIDLTIVVKQALELTEPLLTENRIEVHKTLLPESSALIYGDAIQVEQVLSNLVHNGIDAMKRSKNKVITLTLRVEDKTALLSCKDSGPGITEDKLALLFDPFFTTKETGKGLGLGLSISYGIVQDMNGTIRAENHSEGGACFTISLPIAPHPSSPDILLR